jgi:hypothetical protein
MNTPQPPKPTTAPLFVAMGVACVAAGAGFFLFMDGSDSAQVQRPVPPAAVAQQTATPPTPVAMPAPSPEVAPEPAEVEPPSTPGEPASKASRLARDLEREQIWSSLGRKHSLKPAAPGSAAPTESAAALLPTLDREYIRGAIKEQLVPIAVDCYNTVLTEQDPKAGGEVILKFTIVGDEEIGGVVEAAEIDEESTLNSEFMRECLRESVMTVTFDPPPEGGQVQVTYPLEFAPE